MKRLLLSARRFFGSSRLSPRSPLVRVAVEERGARLVVSAAPANTDVVVTTDSGQPTLHYDDDDELVTLAVGASTKVIELSVPQRLRSARLVCADLAVSGKVEASERLELSADEEIRVDGTVRAQDLVLTAGSVTVSKLLEAERLVVESRSLVDIAKLQASRRATVSAAESLAIESAYCALLQLASGSARIHTLQGHVDADCNGDFELLRLTGSADVACRGNASVSFDAARASSSLRAAGDLSLQLSASDSFDLALEAPTLNLPTITSASSFDVVSDERDNRRRHVSARLRPLSTAGLHRRRGAGKVDVQGAAAQRWQSAVHDDVEADSVAELRATSDTGTLTLAEPLSWIDSIRRNVELAEEEKQHTR